MPQTSLAFWMTLALTLSLANTYRDLANKTPKLFLWTEHSQPRILQTVEPEVRVSRQKLLTLDSRHELTGSGWRYLLMAFLAPVMLGIFATYFYFVGFFVVKSFYQEVWMGKANDYQTLPEARLTYKNLTDEEYQMYGLVDLSSKVKAYNNPDVEVKHLVGDGFNEDVFEVVHKKLDILDYQADMPYYSTLFVDVILKNEYREKTSPWYYFEVEIDTLPPTNNFVVGIMPRPELGASTDIEMKITNGDYDVLPGESEDSVGFSMKTGELMYNGSVEYNFNIEKLLTQFHRPHKIKEYIDNEHLRLAGKRKKKGPDQNSTEMDNYDFKGDTVGIGYHSKSGLVLISFNGDILNRPKDTTLTEVNTGIRKRNLKEELENNVETELKNIEKKGMKYYNDLDIESDAMRDLKNFLKLKVKTGLDYIPVVYAPEAAVYRINLGASPFKNSMPDFAKGVLAPFNTVYHEYLDKGTAQSKVTEKKSLDD